MVSPALLLLLRLLSRFSRVRLCVTPKTEAHQAPPSLGFSRQENWSGQETWVCSLGWEYPLEEGMAIHCSILAWEIPRTEKPGGLQSMEAQSRTRLKRLSMHTQ